MSEISQIPIDPDNLEAARLYDETLLAHFDEYDSDPEDSTEFGQTLDEMKASPLTEAVSEPDSTEPIRKVEAEADARPQLVRLIHLQPAELPQPAGSETTDLTTTEHETAELAAPLPAEADQAQPREAVTEAFRRPPEADAVTETLPVPPPAEAITEEILMEVGELTDIIVPDPSLRWANLRSSFVDRVKQAGSAVKDYFNIEVGEGRNMSLTENIRARLGRPAALVKAIAHNAPLPFEDELHKYNRAEHNVLYNHLDIPEARADLYAYDARYRSMLQNPNKVRPVEVIGLFAAEATMLPLLRTIGVSALHGVAKLAEKAAPSGGKVEAAASRVAATTNLDDATDRSPLIRHKRVAAQLERTPYDMKGRGDDWLLPVRRGASGALYDGDK